jgi:hypothetical protein
MLGCEANDPEGDPCAVHVRRVAVTKPSSLECRGKRETTQEFFWPLQTTRRKHRFIGNPRGFASEQAFSPLHGLPCLGTEDSVGTNPQGMLELCNAQAYAAHSES